MPYLTLAEVARAAANLGHTDLEVVPLGAGTWWRCTCACGYQSTRRRTAALAADAAAHHMTVAARAYFASGRALPPVPVDTPETEPLLGKVAGGR
jgi:hypothetical protein